MSELKKFRGEDYSCDDREFAFEKVDDGVRVYVDGKWWMPAKPFPLGFDKESAQFDSVENAISAVSEQYDLDYFFDMDEKHQILDAKTPAAFAKDLARKTASAKPRRKKRK